MREPPLSNPPLGLPTHPQGLPEPSGLLPFAPACTHPNFPRQTWGYLGPLLPGQEVGMVERVGVVSVSPAVGLMSSGSPAEGKQRGELPGSFHPCWLIGSQQVSPGGCSLAVQPGHQKEPADSSTSKAPGFPHGASALCHTHPLVLGSPPPTFPICGLPAGAWPGGTASLIAPLPGRMPCPAQKQNLFLLVAPELYETCRLGTFNSQHGGILGVTLPCPTMH